MAAVEADPRYKPRHRELLWWLTTYAGDDGIAHVSLARLARDRDRDPSWVRRDVRELAAGGHVVSRASTQRRNRREYLIPAMVAPIRAV
jgi:predicted transcriptional regulator